MLPFRSLAGPKKEQWAFKLAAQAAGWAQLARLECRPVQFRLSKKLDFQLNARQANQRGALGRVHGFLQVRPRPSGATEGSARARWSHAGPNRAAERLPSPQRLVPLFVKF